MSKNFALTGEKKLTMQHASGKRTIIVEGNIGAGKTTFLNHMARGANIQVFPESIEKWTNLNGINLLERMYENPEKWSYTFQNYTLLTHLENHLKMFEKGIKLMERSIYSARYCFCEALLLEQKIEKASFEVFVKWFEYAEQCIQNQVDMFIYLRTTPEVVYDRIQERNRIEEQTVPFEYISHLHNLYEAWLYEKRITRNNIPVFVLDANLPLQTIRTEYERLEQFLASSPLFNIV